MKVTLDDFEERDRLIEAKADGRGRVNLGAEFADKRVRVAVVEVE